MSAALHNEFTRIKKLVGGEMDMEADEQLKEAFEERARVLRQLSTIQRMAAVLGPACALPYAKRGSCTLTESC
jgi:hypothetical protein